MYTKGDSWMKSLFALLGALLLSAGMLFALRAGIVQADVGGQPLAPQATVLYVSAISGDDANPCSQTSPCATIQHAVDVAADGDTIIVAAQDVQLTPTPITRTNVYTGDGENVVLVDKSLTLEGGYVHLSTGGWGIGLRLTQIDGENERRPIAIASGITVTLRRLELERGNTTHGGGLYADGATLELSLIEAHDNWGNYGGGFYLRDCKVNISSDDPLQSGLHAYNNRALSGGGLYVEGGSPVLSALLLHDNQAMGPGGALALEGGAPIIIGGAAHKNSANIGGGLYLHDSRARIAGMLILSNDAVYGGGLYVEGPIGFSEEAIPLFVNNYIRFNEASRSGGAIYFKEAVAGLANNIVAQNSARDGAALYLYASSPQLFHTTIASNTGTSGIYITQQPGTVWPPAAPIPSRPAFTNTILSGHTTGIYMDSTGFPDPFQNHLTMEGTLWWENDTEANGHPELISHEDDVEGDPRYTCTDLPPDCLNPFHILTDSAAMDTGVPVALTLPGTDLFVDIDLETRPSGEGYDLGADEVISDDYSVWLIPPFETRPITPGGTITFVHQLVNSGKESDTYTITFHSAHGWATLLTPPQVTVGTMQSTTVMVRVDVPTDAVGGITDTLLITATSQTDPSVNRRALDLTRVVSPTDLNLVVLKQADRATMGIGEPARFTVWLTKTGTVSGTVNVTLIDHAAPFTVVAGIGLPSNCDATTATGTITCTWALPGADDPITRELHFVITPTATYTGLLLNTARVTADQEEVKLEDNQSTAIVGFQVMHRIYLPMVLKNYRASSTP